MVPLYNYRIIGPQNPLLIMKALAKGSKAQLVLDGEFKELDSVGDPDPHEDPNFEGYSSKGERTLRSTPTQVSSLTRRKRRAIAPHKACVGQ